MDEIALVGEYEVALHACVDGVETNALDRARQLGQKAIAQGLGPPDIARIHSEALLRLSRLASASDRSRLLERAATLLVEVMVPFQEALHSQRETNATLCVSEARYRDLFEHEISHTGDRLEEEVRRIARSLHDEAGQLLASVYLALAELAVDLPPRGRERLKNVFGLLDRAAEQLRDLSHELRPVILDDLGLVPALQFLARGVSKRTGLIVAVDASLDTRLPSTIETTLYRILQEALTNVSKHARAQHVNVRLRKTARAINYSIRDDGVGFDPLRMKPGDHSGLGLLGIRDRLANVGGTLLIRAGAGRGTTLDIRIPFPTGGVRHTRVITDRFLSERGP